MCTDSGKRLYPHSRRCIRLRSHADWKHKLENRDRPLHSDVSAQPLRIALLGYRSNPFSGGQGVYLKYLSQALTELGHHVDVISGEPYPDLDPRVGLIKLPGLNLYAHKRPSRAFSLRQFFQPTDFF